MAKARKTKKRKVSSKTTNEVEQTVSETTLTVQEKTQDVLTAKSAMEVVLKSQALYWGCQHDMEEQVLHITTHAPISNTGMTLIRQAVSESKVLTDVKFEVDFAIKAILSK